jgi:type I restriction enzyme S subunit
VRQFQVPVAPRAEQARIVEAIETHLTKLDAAVAALERVQVNLKRYRASVLKAAVEGRLVPTEAELARREGRDYEPASELLQRILTERRRRWEESELAAMKAKGKTPKDDKWKAKYKDPDPPDIDGLAELPEGWVWGKVEMVGDILLGRRRAPEYAGQVRRYLRVANVRDDRIDFTVLKEMPYSDEEAEAYRLRPGDILVSEGQSVERIGQSAVYRGEEAPLCFQSTLHRFRPYDASPSSDSSDLCMRRTGLFRKAGVGL